MCVSRSGKGLTLVKISWDLFGAYIYAHVLANTDIAERSWLYKLENYALKKHANEELLRKIQEEFEEALSEDSIEYRFTLINYVQDTNGSRKSNVKLILKLRLAQDLEERTQLHLVGMTFLIPVSVKQLMI